MVVVKNADEFNLALLLNTGWGGVKWDSKLLLPHLPHYKTVIWWEVLILSPLFFLEISRRMWIMFMYYCHKFNVILRTLVLFWILLFFNLFSLQVLPYYMVCSSMHVFDISNFFDGNLVELGSVDPFTPFSFGISRRMWLCTYLVFIFLYEFIDTN